MHIQKLLTIVARIVFSVKDFLLGSSALCKEARVPSFKMEKIARKNYFWPKRNLITTN